MSCLLLKEEQQINKHKYVHWIKINERIDYKLLCFTYEMSLQLLNPPTCLIIISLHNINQEDISSQTCIQRALK